MSVPVTARDRVDVPLSASDWVDRTLRATLVRAIPGILESARVYRPRGLLLTGSAALGEAVGWEAEDPTERFVLSDLDLGLVTADRIPRMDRVRIAATARAAASGPRTGSPEALARTRAPWLRAGDPIESGPLTQTPAVEVTLGFYESAWWTRQVQTPGVADARARGRVLWGDDTLPGRMPGSTLSRIPLWEAIRLTGNRALELLAAPGPQSDRWLRPRAWYALAKAVAGLWTARLIFEGRYAVGWGARRELLQRRSRDRGGPPADPVVRETLAWTGFLDRPGEQTLPRRSNMLAGYREALAASLASLPPEFRGPGERSEAAYLREPASLREKWRAWRAEDPRAWGGAARSGASGGPGGHLLSARRVWSPGTPQGRRMAAAVLYWTDLPEQPEPEWGESPRAAGGVPEWEERILRLLGWTVPAGPGCRSRLQSALGLKTAPETGVWGGSNG